MISKHVELGYEKKMKAENSAEIAHSRYQTESIIIITESISVFAFVSCIDLV